MQTKLTTSLLVAVSFLITGCSISVQTELPTAAPPIVITVTLPPAPTARPTDTPLPPPPTPTITPVSGTTSTQVNVRAEPSTAGTVLGVIPANNSVQIIGRDPGGNWWQILYEAGADGKGWVTAQYVTIAGSPEIPVISNGSNDGNSAIVVQQLNVRSGPGTSFDSLGILNANDVVRLTGRNRDNSWLQIAFPIGPDGKGWVNAAFIKAEAVDVLPIVSDAGEVVGTGTPMDTPPPSAPTIVPAPLDFDSSDAPLETVLFERAGTQALIYNGDVSFPDGDTDDWIAFTSYNNRVFAQIECAGNGALRLEFVEGGATLTCNEKLKPIPVQAGFRYIVHIQGVTITGGLGYVDYTLTISINP